MTKYSKLLYVFLLFFFISLITGAQEQKGFLDLLSEKFRNYCNTYPWEEIYIHTDREDYVAGEDIWFKTYLIDRQNFKPASDSKIAYIEILNSENRPVIQKRIRLENGTGPGQLTLPDTLSSGSYTLRAYTNWMKNFLPDNCFTKTLNIYNAISNRSFVSNKNQSQSEKKPSGTAILSNKPVSGFSMTMDNSRADRILIQISTDRNYRSREGTHCYLFVQTHGTVNYKSDIILVDDNTVIELTRSWLIPGINQITIFSETGKPLKDQFIFTPLKKTGEVTMAVNENPGVREKISLKINVNNELIAVQNLSGVSISVTPANGNTFSDMADYMVFGSEFGVLPDEVRRSDLSVIPAEKLVIILAGLKSKWINWSAILSNSRPAIKYYKETENHFLYGRLLNKSTGLADPGSYLFLSIPGKNATFQYSLTDKNGDFSFQMPIDSYIRELIIQPENINKNDYIKMESPFSEKYPESILTKESAASLIPDYVSKLKVNYQVRRIYGSEDTVKISEPNRSLERITRFYGKPDVELVMDDYIKLPVMQEVFFELIPGVYLKNKKSKYEMTIADPIENKIYDKPPVMFVDGVVINDASIIANLDPEMVERIEAVKDKYFVGDYMFYGLVNVITKAGDYSNVTLPDYAVKLPYRVTEPVKVFSTPDYTAPESKQSRIPDFRNTLYWNPTLETDKNGNVIIQFWSSDILSDFKVTANAVTMNGTIISCSRTITRK